MSNRRKQDPEFAAKPGECVLNNYKKLREIPEINEKQIEYDMEHLLQVVNKHKGNIRESVLNLHNTETDLQSKSVERAFKDMNQFEMAKSILCKKNTNTEIDFRI